MTHGPLAQHSDGLTIESPVRKLGINVLAIVARGEGEMTDVTAAGADGSGVARITTRDEFVTLLAGMLPEGFTLEVEVGTGGNCTADIVTAPDGRTLYLTDDASSFLTRYGTEEDLGLTAGYYDADDEEDGYCTFDNDEMFVDNLTATVTLWVEGNPYREGER